jgi:mRNA-degrading endonuclease RelE of RelBE toxin-antitoxin system
MSYNIDVTEKFQKELKRLLKKYKSLKEEYDQLINTLQNNPTLGKSIGHNCYKIRIAIKSKGTGKSGGARIITNVYIEGTTVYLLTIYDKSEQENITDKDLKKLLALIEK